MVEMRAMIEMRGNGLVEWGGSYSKNYFAQ
jgi:hypothetical protein